MTAVFEKSTVSIFCFLYWNPLPLIRRSFFHRRTKFSHQTYTIISRSWYEVVTCLQNFVMATTAKFFLLFKWGRGSARATVLRPMRSHCCFYFHYRIVWLNFLKAVQVIYVTSINVSVFLAFSDKITLKTFPNRSVDSWTAAPSFLVLSLII